MCCVLAALLLLLSRNPSAAVQIIDDEHGVASLLRTMQLACTMVPEMLHIAIKVRENCGQVRACCLLALRRFTTNTAVVAKIYIADIHHFFDWLVHL